MVLGHLLGRYLPKGQRIDFLAAFVVVDDPDADPQRSGIVRITVDRGYDVCVQNVIIVDKLDEYFFVDWRADPAAG